MITKSKSQTQKFAVKLAKKILKNGPGKRAHVLALSGDLGAGKTTFTQGFIKALGVKHRVTSPTFVIFRKYHLGERLKIKDSRNSLTSNLKPMTYKAVYHFDLYRIHRAKEVLALDFKKIIGNPENIVLIEWPERIGKLLSKKSMRIGFEHGKKESERVIGVNILN